MKDWTMFERAATSIQFLLACATIVPFGTASAAEIGVTEISESIAIIHIDGEITSGDLDTFRQISIQYKDAAVILNSDGGELIPALEIGKIIKIAGYSTGVDQNGICASSCALIWLAGSKRGLSAGGQVGFHASYRDNNGRLEESGVANALIGNYLTLLNYPERAIVFATRASPREILWLTQANKASAGIDFDYLDTDETETVSPSPPPIQTVAPPPIVTVPATWTAGLPSHLPARLSQTGENWIEFVSDSYYDSNSIGWAVDRRGKEVWVVVDEQNLSDSRYAYWMAIYYYDCGGKTFIVKEAIHYPKDGTNPTTILAGRLDSPSSVHPGTAEKILMEEVCATRPFFR